MNRPKTVKEYVLRASVMGMVVLVACYIGQVIYSANSQLPLFIKHCFMTVILLAVYHSTIVLLGIPQKFLDSVALVVAYILERFAQAGEGIVDATKAVAKNLKSRHKSGVRR